MTTIDAALAQFESLFVAAGVGRGIPDDPLVMRETPTLDALEAPDRPVAVKPAVVRQAKTRPTKNRVRVRKYVKPEKVYAPHILEAVQYVRPRNQLPPYTLHSLYMAMRKRGCPEIEGKDRRIVAELGGMVVMRINGIEQIVRVK